MSLHSNQRSCVVNDAICQTSQPEEQDMLTLALPARTKYLGTVSAFVLAEARRRGMDASFEPKLELIVEELFINVCRYAYTPPESGAMQVSIFPERSSTPASLLLLFKDKGEPFNPLENVPQPDLTSPLSDRRRGGLGIYLVRRMTSDISYRRNDGNNELSLAFQMQLES